MATSVDVKSRGRRGKNRQTKVHLIFNESDRIQYLKGFKKRKDERRQRAREEMEIRLKEEKKRLKEEQRDLLRKMYQTQKSLPEVDNLVQPMTYDFANHTVTISSITDVDFQGKNDFLLGQNKVDSDDGEEGKNEKQEPLTTEEKPSLSNLKQLRKHHSKKMKASKAMQMKQKIQQKKQRQQTRRKRIILKKRDKHKCRK